MQRAVGFVALALFIATIFAANYAVEKWGVVSVGFGLMAPAAVYFVGLAFTLRDIIQLTLGRIAVTGAIVIGASLSYLVAPDFAVASGVAFLVSELIDFTIFTALMDRSLFLAAALSGIVGIVVDSIIFLQLAFDNLDFLKGQIVGKTWIMLAAIPLVYLSRSLIRRHLR